MYILNIFNTVQKKKENKYLNSEKIRVGSWDPFRNPNQLNKKIFRPLKSHKYFEYFDQFSLVLAAYEEAG